MRTESVGALGQIRTDVELSLTGFADQRLQPLGHECIKARWSRERYKRIDKLVGANGFEPLTSAVSGQRSAN
jgi:hypothetical protein